MEKDPRFISLLRGFGMRNSQFTMTVPSRGDGYKPYKQRECHTVTLCHSIFHTHTRARGCGRMRENSNFYLLLLPNVYINTMTYYDSMTIVVFIRAVAVIVCCHSKKQGDTCKKEHLWN